MILSQRTHEMKSDTNFHHSLTIPHSQSCMDETSNGHTTISTAGGGIDIELEEQLQLHVGSHMDEISNEHTTIYETLRRMKAVKDMQVNAKLHNNTCERICNIFLVLSLGVALIYLSQSKTTVCSCKGCDDAKCQEDPSTSEANCECWEMEAGCCSADRRLAGLIAGIVIFLLAVCCASKQINLHRSPSPRRKGTSIRLRLGAEVTSP
mmetsp:Transcript_30888/g.61222  ORF Transcript_30888/g.61222 Transcript_30888/m.61222 type:complete len:208 (+) Transcript_30888:230-853(+)